MDPRKIPGLAEAIAWNSDLEASLLRLRVISEEDLKALKVGHFET